MPVSQSQGSIIVAGGSLDTTPNSTLMETQLEQDAHNFFRHSHNEGSLGDDLRGHEGVSVIDHEVIADEGSHRVRGAGIASSHHSGTDIGSILAVDHSDPVDMTRVDFDSAATAVAVVEAAKQVRPSHPEDSLPPCTKSTEVVAQVSSTPTAAEKVKPVDSGDHSGATSTAGDSNSTDLDSFSPMHIDGMCGVFYSTRLK